MSEPNDDPRLSRVIRDALARRDPGPAPFGLRERVLDVPEATTAGRQVSWRRAIVPALGLAAAVLLAVIGIGTFGNLAPARIAGASVAAGSPGVAPSPSFDPTLVGPGVSPTEDFNPAFIVILAIGILAVLAISINDRRGRLIPVAVAVALGGWGLVGTFAPVGIGTNGWGLGLNIVQAAQVPGSNERLLYEVAARDDPFTLGLYLHGDAGPVPFRIEGIVSPAYDRRSFQGVLFTTLWIDEQSDGGMSGPARPFAPFDLSGSFQSVWLVGRAGRCAVGPTFDPTKPDPASGYASFDSLDVRVTVFGWPRVVRVPLGFSLVEPEGNCP